MRVEIWTDIICPWCGIGENRLRAALVAFGHEDEIDLVYRSFQLDENAPTTTQRARDMLKHKKGMSDAQIDSVTKRIEDMARADGLTPYLVADNLVGNTSLAHQLAAWATDLGRGHEMWALLYRSYFGEGKSVFDIDALVALATELGLDAAAAREALTSRRYEAQVLADGRAARELGTGGVPFIVIDGRYAISGAQPVEVMLQALQTAYRTMA